jgi:elongation factor P
MKITAIEIKPGTIIEHEKDLWLCLKAQHVKPGKGGAFNQVELKSITKGTKLNERFRSDETVEKASLDERNYQFLYSDEQNLFFMDTKDYEQITISKDLVGDDEYLMTENLDVVIEFYDEKPLKVTLPKNLEFEVIETDAAVKGQTASSSYKPAVIKNNIKILVPPFINQGDMIVIDSETREYVKKVN